MRVRDRTAKQNDRQTDRIAVTQLEQCPASPAYKKVKTLAVHTVSVPPVTPILCEKSRPLNALTEDVPANGLSVQRATATKLLRVAVKLDTCDQLSEAGS